MLQLIFVEFGPKQMVNGATSSEHDSSAVGKCLWFDHWDSWAPLKKKKESKYSPLLFFIPIIVVGALVVVAFVSSFSGSGNGSLQVEATASLYPSGSVNLAVQAGVNGTVVTTPSTLSLRPGHYVVTFADVQGFWAPTSKHIPVQSGKTVFAVEDYTPIKEVVDFSSTSFNSTHLTAVHGVTPVIWRNVSSQVVTLQSKFFGTIPVQPGGNTSYVFQTTGTYTFWIYNDQSVAGTITVS